jgi:hypothetical protein
MGEASLVRKVSPGLFAAELKVSAKRTTMTVPRGTMICSDACGEGLVSESEMAEGAELKLGIVEPVV